MPAMRHNMLWRMILPLFVLFCAIAPVSAHFLLNLNVRILHVDHLADAGVEGVHCWMATEHPYSEVLRSLGFVASRDSVTFTFEPLSIDAESVAYLADPHASIHFMHGDSDWI